MRPDTLKSTWTRLIRWQQPTKRYTTSDIVTFPPRLSTVHQGNAFEERSLAVLRKTMSMSLKRVGGKEDGGIDLLGWWWLPPVSSDPSSSSLDASSSSKRSRIRVIGQCKAEKKKTGPKYIRELEGVLFRLVTTTNSLQNAPHPESVELNNSGISQFPIIALLISESEFTKSAILRANSSPIPFLLLHLPAIDNPGATEEEEDDDDPGELGMALCNPALCGTDGLLKGRMELRWERFEFGGSGRPALWWGNRKLHSWTPELVTPKPE